MVPLLVAAASLVRDSDMDGKGGERVKRKALSMRMIWLKLGLMLGSSTQHDCTINARSGDISSGRLGLSCCTFLIKQKSVRNTNSLDSTW